MFFLTNNQLFILFYKKSQARLSIDKISVQQEILCNSPCTSLYAFHFKFHTIWNSVTISYESISIIYYTSIIIHDKTKIGLVIHVSKISLTRQNVIKFHNINDIPLQNMCTRLV